MRHEHHPIHHEPPRTTQAATSARCVHKSKWPKDSMRQVSLSHIYLTLARGPASIRFSLFPPLSSQPSPTPLLSCPSARFQSSESSLCLCSQFTQNFWFPAGNMNFHQSLPALEMRKPNSFTFRLLQNDLVTQKWLLLCQELIEIIRNRMDYQIYYWTECNDISWSFVKYKLHLFYFVAL